MMWSFHSLSNPMLRPSIGPIPIFLDTSYLRTAGFGHPDFRKLIEYSKAARVRLFVSFIAWEERRTQFLSDITSQMEQTRREFDKLCRKQSSNFFLQGLPSPSLDLWDMAELETRSHSAMAAFAEENHIVVVPIGSDHADRAWRRYFSTDLPFNSQEPDRVKRRKDIPDSWILEAAIDVTREHGTMVALCGDGRFSSALKQLLGAEVFESAEDVLDLIDSQGAAATEEGAEEPRVAEGVTSVAGTVESSGPLGVALDAAESNFRMVATKIIGLVAYLGAPPKDQLHAILEGSGISVDVSRNVAARLVLTGIISDTGNHYV
jgi:hypothetical protein